MKKSEFIQRGMLQVIYQNPLNLNDIEGSVLIVAEAVKALAEVAKRYSTFDEE